MRPVVLGNSGSTRQWNDSEDQVLFDATMRGDGWPGLGGLLTTNARSPEEILARMEELKNARLPAMWTQTHVAAQKFLRDRFHRGEDNLKEEEWRELAVWVYNGYVGINPSVFHYSRCTERLRKEVRVLEDLDAKVVVRIGAFFAGERSRSPPKTQVSVLVPGKSTMPKPQLR